MNLRFAILGLLSISPMNGYLLKKIFDRSINPFWAANLSQIYRELNALEEKEYVSSIIQEQADRPDKRIYSITAAGSDAFLKWLSDFPDTLIPPGRDPFSLRIFFGARLKKEDMTALLHRFIDEQKNLLEKTSENKRQILELIRLVENKATPEEELCMRFISRRTIITVESQIRWAEECLAVLSQSPGPSIESETQEER